MRGFRIQRCVPVEPDRLHQDAPNLAPGLDQPVNALGRPPEFDEIPPGVIGDGVEEEFDEIDAVVIERLGRVPDPTRQSLLLLPGPALHPDRKRGDLPDQNLAKGGLRIKLGHEGSGAKLDLRGILLGQNDAGAGQAMLEAIASRDRFSLG